MRSYIIGCDPGGNGGFAILDGTSGELVECAKMPSTPMDILNYLKNWNGCSLCYLEDVGNGMPGQSSKATATFARHNGHLEMALLSLGISTVKVSPAKWQKALGLSGKKGESKTSHKNRIKAWAQQRFPQQKKITLAVSDAIAIAVYGYEQRK